MKKRKLQHNHKIYRKASKKFNLISILTILCLVIIILLFIFNLLTSLNKDGDNKEGDVGVKEFINIK